MIRLLQNSSSRGYEEVATLAQTAAVNVNAKAPSTATRTTLDRRDGLMKIRGAHTAAASAIAYDSEIGPSASDGASSEVETHSVSSDLAPSAQAAMTSTRQHKANAISSRPASRYCPKQTT